MMSKLGGTVIPAARADAGRPMLIRYLSAGIPTVSALHVKENASLLRGKTVFLGVTALSAARDRLLNPYGVNVPGVEVHAHAFETMARGDFLRRAGDLAPLGLSMLFAAGAGLAFALLSGWTAYAVAVAIVVIALIAPMFSSAGDWCFPCSVRRRWRGCLAPGRPPISTSSCAANCGGASPRNRATSKPSTGPRTRCGRR